MAREYAAHIYEAIEDALNAEELKFKGDPEEGQFTFGFNLKGMVDHCDMKIRVNDEHFLVYAYIKNNANEEHRLAVADFISRANYGLRNGNFEIDMRDGEIRYKCFVDCGEGGFSLPDPAIISKSVFIPPQMIQRYGGGLMGVMFGFQTAEDAIKEIEG